MRQQPRTMLGELKVAAVAMEDAVTDIVVRARSICSEVADELEGQDYEHETLRVVLNQIDRLRALADDLTEPRL
tara:strand:+ start:742 stop:963 length:222 start_codon:yes stop_codon:yes gene_type:complete